MRLAVGIEYDGRPFCGWQSQPSHCGIQDHLEKAIGSIAGERIVVNAAGRTDQGVHATAQVAHFETAADRPLTAWVRGVNALLPDAIAVSWAGVVTGVNNVSARITATSEGKSDSAAITVTK